MLRNRKALERRQPLKRKTRMRRVSNLRHAENLIYSDRRRIFLSIHSLCQITMAIHRIDESLALWTLKSNPPALWEQSIVVNGIVVPFATEVHHRNRRSGSIRYLTESFWMSSAAGPHRWAEEHAGEARSIGVICPINASPDGAMPDGGRCLTTEELLRVRADGGDQIIWEKTS